MGSSIKAFLGWSCFIVLLSVLSVGMWRKTHPIYSAEVSLLVEVPRQTTGSPAVLPFGIYVSILQSDDFNRYANSSFNAEELALIHRGFEPLGLQPDADGRAVPAAHLLITAKKSSAKIFIKVRSAVPEAAALVANRWAYCLIEYEKDRWKLPRPVSDGVARIQSGPSGSTAISFFDPALIPTRADNAWW